MSRKSEQIRDKLKVLWTNFYPFILSILFSIFIVHYTVFKVSYDLILDRVSGVVINIGGIFAGFFLTVFTIIDTINTSRFKSLRSNPDNYKRLLNYLKLGIRFNIILVLISCLIPIISNTNAPDSLLKYIFGAYLWLILATLLLSFRFSFIFLMFMKRN